MLGYLRKGKEDTLMGKRNPKAKALANPLFRKRVVRDKTKYTRKGRRMK